MTPLADPDPNETPEFHYRKKVIELGRSLDGMTKVYLDTKFWIWLADHSLGKAVPSGVGQLSVSLRKGVSDGRFICPFNFETFSEVFKQSDPQTLRSTAKMVDGLSRNVCMMAWPERQKAELLHFVKSRMGGGTLHPLCHMVWTRPLYVTGLMIPAKTPFDAGMERAIQKSFMDHAWTLTLVDMLDVRGEASVIPRPLPNDISSELNEGKDSHADEHKDLKSLFLAELAGMLDASADDLEWVMATVYRDETGKEPTAQELELSRSERSLAKLIYNGYRLDRLSTELPFLHIPTTIHAAIRWDRQRRFKANDLPDIGHARAALPYCDLFLTERSLAAILTRKDLSLDSRYGCRVVSSLDDAVSSVEELADRR